MSPYTTHARFPLLFTICAGIIVFAQSILWCMDKQEKQPESLAAAALWEKFTTAIKNGDMQQAYMCFTPQSRVGMSFYDFCSQYHPVTAACEAILGNITDSSLNVSENKAILSFVSSADNSTKGTFVKVYMIKESGIWLLVTESCWWKTVSEADGRLLLKNIYNLFSKAPTEKELKNIVNNFHTTQKEFVSQPLFKSVEQIYYIKIRIASFNSWKVSIVPKDMKSGLRAFNIDNNGYLSEVEYGQENVK